MTTPALPDRRCRRRVRRIVAILAWLSSAGAPGVAERQPVLPQVQVPHPYYWREMYLPQVAGGPTSVAWSADGTELFYSTQGSLWRQRLDSTAARQLTDGPGYDHQPDASPDGRSLAYVSYDGRSIELRLLDLAAGVSRPLTSNGGVNVEPRFAPDGRRIAYISTAHEGRFHLFVMELEGERAGTAERWSDDVASPLPRYYYGAHDQVLSPSWSPDGRELVLISNRDQIYGSGGLFRMAARPSAPLRPIHLEETTWKARPDLARDGRRIVFSSYAGRQWNQLWLLAAEGGWPLQLTYGDFDATAPRWSPDGRRIAYIANESGVPESRVIEVPGGRIARLESRDRVYLGATARLELAVRDERGGILPARISVRGADGRHFAPDGALRQADDGFDRAERRFEHGYWHARPEPQELVVPAGETAVEVTRGLEWRPWRTTVTLAAGETRRLAPVLGRLDDLPARGFWSGDLHVHMNYGGTYRHRPASLRDQMLAEDLHLVENLIVNKEQRIPDIAYFDRDRADPVSDSRALLFHGEEYHTSFWGHLSLLRLRDHFVMPNYAAYPGSAAASLFPHNAAIADDVRAQGGLVGYVHLYDTPPDPAAARRLTHEFPVDVALGKVDFFEAVGFDDSHLTTQEVWYRLLNLGFRVPAAGGTDAMANFASLHGPVGMCRTYAKSGALEREAWLNALREGRTFATNGPLLELELAGRGIGDVIELAAPGRLRARVAMRSIVPVDHLQLVVDGSVAAEVPLAADRTTAEATVELAFARSGWVVLRAFTAGGRHPILDSQVSATTSPIFVSIAGAPARAADDARFFLAWIDRMEAAASDPGAYNSAAERDAVLATLAAARREFRERGRGPGLGSGPESGRTR